MFCPKCGTENPQGTNLCQNCGQMLTIPQASAVQIAKTSALAVTSMILGILSLCTCLLTAPVAFILAIISLILIAKSKGQLKGMGFAITGIVVPFVAIPFVALILGIMMPALSRARMVAQRMVCGTNLSTLSKEILIYTEDNNNMLPPMDQWCDTLMKFDANLTPKSFRCPSDKEGPSSYSMNKNIIDITKTDPQTVLLFESKPGWNQSGGPELLTTEYHFEEGCNVAFCDGHVSFIKTDEIKNLKWTAAP